MKLTNKDYINILKFYKINYNTYNSRTIKHKAEEILASKLCRCIKKVKTKKDINEFRAIGICKSSVLNKKNLTVGRFSCKKHAKFLKDKNNNTTLKKVRKY
tara:strand:+ start:8561 stop:8863 length:303 start_codon:yes stop_codon:yes gene_type:complete